MKEADESSAIKTLEEIKKKNEKVLNIRGARNTQKIIDYLKGKKNESRERNGRQK